MKFVNDINLDKKAIDIVTNYITEKSSKWVPLKLPECMHIDGEAWVYEKYIDENLYDFNIEIISKAKLDFYTKYILICDSRLDSKLFDLTYTDASDQWVLRVYGQIDAKAIKNTEKEKNNGTL